MKRPDAQTFAQYSYILAFATSGIITFVLFFGMIANIMSNAVPALSNVSAILSQTLWFVLITSALGTFMSNVALKEFKTKPPAPDLLRKTKVARLVNSLALAAMVLGTLLFLSNIFDLI